MAVAALAAGLGASLLKKGPKIPKYKKVDQTAEQTAAIEGNLANFAQARELAARTSAADQEILEANLESAMPGYRNLISGASGAIGNMIAGRLPMADQGMIMRRAAEGGVGMGLGGSQAGRNLVARDLGLSQLSMTQAGLGALNPFMSTVRSTSVASPMAVGSSYLSPENRVGRAIQENQFAYQAAVGKAKSDAANNPFNRAMNFVSGAAGMYAGNFGMGQGLAAGMGGGGGGGFMSGIRSGLGRIFGGSSSLPTNPTPIGVGFNPTTGASTSYPAGYGKQ
jgi:hypothetical protein